MMMVSRFPRLMGVGLAVALLAGCGRGLDEPPADLGPFKLGLNIVVADNMQMVPISRPATVEQWETGLKKAVADRFGRYQGDRFYNIGINVDGYALAPPGVPIVASPKSVVVVTANIWDDATSTRLNPEPRQFTIFENMSPDLVVGSGYTKTAQEQLDQLSYNVAQALENWFLENPQWFDPVRAIPGAAPPSVRDNPPPTVFSAGGAKAAPAAAAAPVVVTEEVMVTPLPESGAATEAAGPTSPLARTAPPRRPGG